MLKAAMLSLGALAVNLRFGGQNN